jgi:hypothetical protein
MKNAKEKEKICANCKYIAWLIGVGFGLRCSHASKRVKGEMPPLIPSKLHSCDLFEYAVKQVPVEKDLELEKRIAALDYDKVIAEVKLRHQKK